MKNKFIANLAVALIALLAAGTCLEIGLRIAGFGNLQSIVRYDEFTGYRLAPNTQTHYHDVLLRISSQGLRDRVILPKKAKARRILCLGDSQTFGDGVQINEAYPKVLESRCGIQTVNAGCPGWGPDQEALYLRHYGDAFQPNVVTFSFYIGNDFDDLVAPLSDKFVVTDISSLFKQISLIRSGRLHDSIGRQVKSYLRYTFRSYPFIVDHFKAAKAHAALLLRGRRASGTADLPMLLRMYATDAVSEQEMKPIYEKAEKILLDVKDYCDKRGLKLYFVVIPREIQVNASALTRVLKEYNLDKDLFSMQLPNKRLAEICAKHGIAVLDPTEEFADNYKLARLPLYLEDGHLNAGGHARIAEMLSRELCANK